MNSLLSALLRLEGQHHFLCWYVSYYGRRKFTYTIIVYRKPTHTNPYLAYDSQHPPPPLSKWKGISEVLRRCLQK